MRVLVRDGGRRAQMVVEDGDEVKNFLFLPAALKGAASAAMALAPQAKKLIESVARKHAAKVGVAAVREAPEEGFEEEEEEYEADGYTIDDLASSWDASLTGTFDGSDPTEIHAYVSPDGRTLGVTLPYADLIGAEEVLDTIDEAARAAGLEIRPGTAWQDHMLPIGDAEVKHFLPVVAGLAGSLLGKGGIIGKALKGLKGLFGKKKKRRKKRGGASEPVVYGGSMMTTSQGEAPQQNPLQAMFGQFMSSLHPSLAPQAQPSPAVGSIGPGGGVVMAAGSVPGSALSQVEAKPMWGSSGTPWPVGPGAPAAPLGEPIRPVSMIQNVVSNTWTPSGPVSARATITPVPVNPTQPMHPERIQITRSESDETVTYSTDQYYYGENVAPHLDYAGGVHFQSDGVRGE